MSIVGRPQEDEYAPYYADYVAEVGDRDVIAVLRAQLDDTSMLLGKMSGEQAAHRYAPDKWSVKEVIGHIVDTERVFAFRAMSIARGETQPLPGMDQDPYVAAGRFDRRPLASLQSELAHQRRANLELFAGFDADAWRRTGVANDAAVSVRALAFIMAGHEAHHVRVVRERYLTK